MTLMPRSPSLLAVSPDCLVSVFSVIVTAFLSEESFLYLVYDCVGLESFQSYTVHRAVGHTDPTSLTDTLYDVALETAVPLFLLLRRAERTDLYALPAGYAPRLIHNRYLRTGLQLSLI